MDKKAYFIGIAGKAMAPLANSLKSLGWNVSGSDQKGIYPPISTYLEERGLKYFDGYNAENVPDDADIIVVGRSALMIDKNNSEYLRAKETKSRVLSYPEVLEEFLIKENSIVVVGTYGKTTISAIVSWILINANLDPSFMTGGVPINMADGVKITNSKFSVVEGDEPPALFEGDLPKFMHYHPKILVVTATKHDHPEIYKTPESYINAFIELVKLIPKDGKLIYNKDNTNPEVVKQFSGEKISYSFSDKNADYFIDKTSTTGNLTEFVIKGKKILSLNTILIGRHNLENLLAAVTACLSLGIDEKTIIASICSFLGVKTRLEFLGKFNGRYLYWDLAQHPAKVKGTLEALREHYKNNKIICVYDPAMTGMKYRESLNWYPGSFDSADRVIVTKVTFLKGLTDRVSGNDIVKAISQTQKNVVYEPIDEKVIDYLINQTADKDVIVFMSSGGLRFINLIEKVKEELNGR